MKRLCRVVTNSPTHELTPTCATPSSCKSSENPHRRCLLSHAKSSHFFALRKQKEGRWQHYENERQGQNLQDAHYLGVTISTGFLWTYMMSHPQPASLNSKRTSFSASDSRTNQRLNMVKSLQQNLLTNLRGPR